MHEVTLPPLAEGVTKATVSYWHHKPGDRITQGEDLVELVTDKATFNMPAPSSGTLKEIRAQEGDEVTVGHVMATIE